MNHLQVGAGRSEQQRTARCNEHCGARDAGQLLQPRRHHQGPRAGRIEAQKLADVTTSDMDQELGSKGSQGKRLKVPGFTVLARPQSGCVSRLCRIGFVNDRPVAQSQGLSHMGGKDGILCVEAGVPSHDTVRGKARYRRGLAGSGPDSKVSAAS